MLTVKEVADKFDVTKVTVYRKINNSLKEDLKPYVVQKDGVTHLLPEGVRLIGESLGCNSNVKKDVKEEEDTTSEDPDIKAILNRLNKLETEYIDTLKKELERKNEQLEKKDELLRNFQVITQQNQERILELEGEVEERRQSWWERLKWW